MFAGKNDRAFGAAQWWTEGNYSDVFPEIGGWQMPRSQRRRENPYVYFFFCPPDGRLTPTFPEGGQLLWFHRAYHPPRRTPANVKRGMILRQTSNVIPHVIPRFLRVRRTDTGETMKDIWPVLYSEGTRSNRGTSEECFQAVRWVTIETRTDGQSKLE
jgi:hypothetical protein